MLGYRALSFYFGMWGLQRWLTSRKRQAREAKRDGRTSSEVGCVSYVRGCSRNIGGHSPSHFEVDNSFTSKIWENSKVVYTSFCLLI